MADSPRQVGLVKAATGLIAGIVATGPMTAAMILWHRRLPLAQRYPLPPREITGKIAAKAGVRDELSESGESAATLLSHFGYGSAAGLLYAFLTGNVTLPGVLKESSSDWWSGRQVTWPLPAAGILKRYATSCRAQFLMIGAHVIWGAVLGIRGALRGRDHTCRN
jgi:putative membrane protein